MPPNFAIDLVSFLIHAPRHHDNGSVSLRDVLMLCWLEAEPRNCTQLALLSQSSTANVTQRSDIMIERGWIKRTVDPRDRRSYQIQLTKYGHTFLNSIRPKDQAPGTRDQGPIPAKATA